MSVNLAKGGGGRARVKKPAFDPDLYAMQVCNTLLTREALANRMQGKVDVLYNIDEQAGYPTDLTPSIYRDMYDRNDVAQRVVNIYPDECWALDPGIYETDDEDESPWEKAWRELNKRRNIIHYMHRVDRISGIGHYGGLLIGINDGRKLSQPVAGMPPDVEDLLPGFKAPAKRDITFMRPFDETCLEILRYEENEASPRFGRPTMYRVKVLDYRNDKGVNYKAITREFDVHWHRMYHVADNRESSEVFGTPRQRCVFNRLCDLRKTLGGAGEMFWKGGFPGYAFEMPAELAAMGGVIDETKLKEQLKAYWSGLERYLALKGLTAKSLAPQVASPKDHVYVILQAISVAIGVPMRVFIGSEEAKLSSTQDAITWNKRLQRRQDKYITPMLVKPLLDRLVLLGVLPTPNDIIVSWPDLNTSTDTERADVAEKMTKAMSLYIQFGGSQLMDPVDFFVYVVGLTLKQAQAIWKKAQGAEINLAPPQTQIEPTAKAPAKKNAK